MKREYLIEERAPDRRIAPAVACGFADAIAFIRETASDYPHDPVMIERA
jgi:hypothetical protein